MTTPVETPKAIVKKELDPHESARKRIGRKRGVDFLELLVNGNVNGLESFRNLHLSPTHNERNYGSIETEFNKTVGESLARDYAGMFDEKTRENNLYFMQTRLQGLKSDVLPLGVRKVIGQTLKNIYKD